MNEDKPTSAKFLRRDQGRAIGWRAQVFFDNPMTAAPVLAANAHILGYRKTGEGTVFNNVATGPASSKTTPCPTPDPSISLAATGHGEANRGRRSGEQSPHSASIDKPCPLTT